MERVSYIFLFITLLLAFPGKLCSGPLEPNNSDAIEFSLYEENGKVGLKNEQGEILIPAQYDGMGWSNGQFSIINNVTGYQSGSHWGLINLENNRITKAEYTDLSPGEGSLIVARKKITGTVMIRAGCIDTSGKEVIPFHYDGLRVSSFRAIVYVRNGSQFKHGLIDFENKLLIPLQYRNIYPLGSLRYGVENFDNKTAIFSEDGKQITNFLIDSLSSFKKNYAIIYQKQRQGLINRQGQIKLEPTYREIQINKDGTVNARRPDLWLWLTSENKSGKQCNADSVEVVQPNLIKVSTSGKIQLTDKEFKPVTEQLFSFVGPFEKGKAIFRIGDKTGIIDHDGKVIIKPVYKDLIIDHPFIRANQPVNYKDRWIVLDSAGSILTSKGYDRLAAFNGEFFPAQHRGYWGAVNAKGKEIVACVHDSIGAHLNEMVVVKFKGKYGVINLDEDWLVTPQANKIELLNNDRYFEISPRTKFLKSYKGEIIYFSDNRLEMQGDHLLEYLSTGGLWKIDMSGVITERTTHLYDSEMIFPESEGLRAIKKDGRYGFVDDQGRLRIANRYEGVKRFSGTFAAVKIRGRWGFINHADNIAVQPVYDDVIPFREGLSIVSQNNLYGLLDKNAKLIMPVRYDSIVLVGDKRVKVQQDGLWGLADDAGRMIINPKFDQLTVLGNGHVITSRDGKSGLLTPLGVNIIPQLYDDLVFDPYHNEYIALKRMGWEAVKF